jgi:hypothetical protein
MMLFTYYHRQIRTEGACEFAAIHLHLHFLLVQVFVVPKAIR